MSRKARQKSPTDFYHVTARGINQEAILTTRKEKDYFLKILHEGKEEYPIGIYAYCIMKNHIHILINAKLEALSSFMAKILAQYAKFYNFKYERIGYVFQGRYHSESITDESYFWNCLRYIHQNPLKAGIVNNPVRYKYSSLQDYYDRDTYILYEEALELIDKRFENTRALLDFHKTSCATIFYDTDEEVRKRRLEIAVGMIREMCHMYNMEPDVLWSSGRHRKECMEKGKSLLKTSVRETTNILEIASKKVGTG